jgi:hypothetical protein
MPRLSDKLTVRQASYRLCLTAGCRTRVHGNRLHCARCYRNTPEGAQEANQDTRRRYWEHQEAKRQAAGKPLPAFHCQRCVQWEHRCLLGFPEGVGTFAEDCAAFLPAMTTDNPLHPIQQQEVQYRLDRAYLAAGRQNPLHPFHARYTDVFGELAAKGIELD